MNGSAVTILLDSHGASYRPTETLAGFFRVDVDSPDEVKSVELSVLWYTEGKGDEDFGVHHFERFTMDQDRNISVEEPVRFACELPRSPLSYDGAIVKVRWCVRVRAFFWGGKQVAAEKHFQLGHVPAVRALVE